MEVYNGFGETEAESRAMLLFDLLGKKTLTHDSLNLKQEGNYETDSRSSD